MIGLDSSGRLFNEKLEEVNQYLLNNNFPRELQQKIQTYFHLKYSKSKIFNEDSITSELNEPLRKVTNLE